MFDQYLFFYMLFGLASIYLAIGIWSARSVKTLQNYFLANRNLGIFRLTFALIASQLGSGMILGTAYRAYHTGLWGIFYTVGMSLGFIILGCGLASRMRSLNISTTAEIFETHYNSAHLKMIASFLSILSLWGILVAQMVASKTLFLGLGITDHYIFISCWLFVIIYAMLGGLHSIVLVDITQVSFIITIFTIACTYAVSLKFLKYLTPPKLAMIQNHFFYNSGTLLTMLPVLCIPVLFSLIEQDLAQKFFAAKTQATATIASFLAGIFLILFSCIPIYFGAIAKIKHINFAHGANPLIASLEQLCPSWIFLLAICGIFAAITSTASSLLCAISSNVVQDFTAFLKLEHQKLFITKLISFGIGISAIIACSFVQADIISILEESYRISVVCLFIPICCAYFIKPNSSAPAWLSFLSGFIGYISLYFVQMPIFTKDICALSLSLLGYISAYLSILKKR